MAVTRDRAEDEVPRCQICNVEIRDKDTDMLCEEHFMMQVPGLESFLEIQKAVHALTRDSSITSSTDWAGNMTCREVEALATIFRLCGEPEDAERMLRSHAWCDDEPDDEHHDEFIEMHRTELEKARP